MLKELAPTLMSLIVFASFPAAAASEVTYRCDDSQSSRIRVVTDESERNAVYVNGNRLFTRNVLRAIWSDGNRTYHFGRESYGLLVHVGSLDHDLIAIWRCERE